MRGLLLLGALCVGQAAAQPATATLSAQCDSDFVLGGAKTQIYHSAVGNYWRTGSPNQTATLTLTDDLAPGAVVESVAFSYRYLAAYGP